MSVRECAKIACYNQRNNRECWTVVHPDGRQSYEWPSREIAEQMAALPFDEAVVGKNNVHQASFC